MDDPAPLPLVIASLAAVGLSLLIWLGIALRLSHRQPVLPWEPRRPVPWRAIEICLVLLTYVLLQVGSGVAIGAIYGRAIVAPAVDEAVEKIEGVPPGLLVPLLLANAVCNVAVVGLTIVLFRATVQATPRDLGFSPLRPGYDLPLGVVAFLAALLPVYGIQAVLTQFFPSKHPVTTLLTENSDLASVALCVLAAVIVAPLAEEFLFRGVLQGWLEAVEHAWRRRRGLTTGPHNEPEISREIAALAALIPESPGVATPGLAAPNTDPPSTNPYAAPVRGEQVSPSSSSPPSNLPWLLRPIFPLSGPALAARFSPGVVPIVLSSLGFALVHLGHGPDPIPLFVLALLLGYLYQRTHRIWPCVVLHMCLNATSLIVLWLTLKKE